VTASRRTRALSHRLLGAIVATLAASPSPAQEGLEIVRRSIEHHGGALYESSLLRFRLCSGSGCYDVEVETDGGLYRQRVAGPVRAGHREVEATNDGVRHWQNGVEMPVTEADEQRLRDWVSARTYFALLPYKLADPGVRQQDLGLERWGERQLHRVKVTFRAGSSTDADDEFLFWFDPETARLEQFAYSFLGSPGGLRFRPLENHRRVGGILFFDQQNLGVDADGLSVDRIDPSFVERSMRAVSQVRLDGIEVAPAGPIGAGPFREPPDRAQSSAPRPALRSVHMMLACGPSHCRSTE
jgi:hypothetical protein